MRFNMRRIERNASDRTHLYALRPVMMTNTLGAQIWMDLVNLDALKDRLIRAHRLADIAVNAQLGDLQGHTLSVLLAAEAFQQNGDDGLRHQLFHRRTKAREFAHQRGREMRVFG